MRDGILLPRYELDNVGNLGWWLDHLGIATVAFSLGYKYKIRGWPVHRLTTASVLQPSQLQGVQCDAASLWLKRFRLFTNLIPIDRTSLLFFYIDRIYFIPCWLPL